MIVESDEDATDLQDDGIVLTGTAETSSCILAVNGKIEGHEIKDIIVDTGSAVSLVSLAFYDNIKERHPLQPSKGNFMVANGSLLEIKGSLELTICLDTIELQHKFLCVDTKVTQALIGYDFIRKNKIDILTSANCLIAHNVPILTHIHKSRKSVGVILTDNSVVYPSTEQILTGQTEDIEAHLTAEECCVIEPESLIEDKLGLLVARGLVSLAKPLPIRVINLSNTPVKLKAGMRIRSLMALKTEEESLCLNIAEIKLTNNH